MYVLVVNAGSSSLKYQLFDTTSAAVLAKGICERIGLDGFLSHKTADGRKLEKEFPIIPLPQDSLSTRSPIPR